MIARKWIKKQAQSSIQRLVKYTFTRKWLHLISEKTRGPSIVFLRCRRVLPDNALGREHREASNPGALFPKQLKALLNEIEQSLPFLYLGEAISMLRSGKALDKSYAVLTFDEAYDSSISAALPILEEMNIPATFFVCSEHLQLEKRLTWDEEVHAIIAASSPAPLRLPWMDRQLQTHPQTHAINSANDLLQHLIQLSAEKRLQRLNDLRNLLTSEIHPSPIDTHLAKNSLKHYANHVLLSFGAHGHSHHPLLSMAPQKRIEELMLCRQILTEVCGQSFVDVLSFPFGHQNQISPDLIQDTMSCGFLAALYAGEGVSRPGDHLFALPRLLLSKNTQILEAYELQGLSTALDEALLVLTGSETSRGDTLVG